MRLRRRYSVPERLGLLGWVAGAVAPIHPALSHATGLSLPCPLRALTGVPCPLCGMTTAAVQLAGGDLAGAVAANPFVIALAVLAATVAPLLVIRAVGWAAPPAAASERVRRTVGWAVAVAAAASWAYQLHRFEFL